MLLLHALIFLVDDQLAGEWGSRGVGCFFVGGMWYMADRAGVLANVLVQVLLDMLAPFAGAVYRRLFFLIIAHCSSCGERRIW